MSLYFFVSKVLKVASINMKYLMNIRKVLFPLLGLLGIFVLIVLTMNLSLFDEELNTEIVDIMKPRPMPAENENAYFAIWGLAAASDKEMMSAGIGLINRYLMNRDKKGADEIFPEDYDEIFGGQDFDTEWLDTYSRCSSRTEYGCLLKMSTQLVSTPITSERLKVMLNRYTQIVQMTKFQQINHTSIATPLPAFSAVLRLNQIKLAQLYNMESHELFVEQVKVDLEFWKIVLVQGNTLMDKMVAIASIWTDIQYLSEFIRTKSPSKELQTKVVRLLEPLTTEQLDISDAFITEATMLYRSVSNITQEEMATIFGLKIFPVNLLLQPNATNNSHYENFLKPIVRLNKLSKDQFYQEIQLDSIDLNKAFAVNFNPSNLYNLSGKLLLNFSIWSPEDYIARVHDLNGMISLVKLQVQLKDVTGNSVESTINVSTIKSPYTDKTMAFDKENNWLGFDCLGKSAYCKIKL